MSIGVYAAYNLDNEIRKVSSSGGVFTAIAEQIIGAGGVVVGVELKYDHEGKFHCEHRMCWSKDELHSLRGSKYVPSEMTGIYKEIKKNVISGKKVLYCGLPCQVAALKKYIGKEYDNLFTVDFICHGVPAPKVLEKISEELTKQHSHGIKEIQFRDKSSGWRKYSFSVNFGENEYKQLAYNSNFMKLFLSDMYLRPSCYRCQHKGIDRVSDITLGDFWGIEKYFPQYSDDDDGFSIIILQSKKGEKLINEIREKIFLQESCENVFKTDNIYIRERAIKPYDYKKYHKMLQKNSTDIIIKKLEKNKGKRILIKKIQRKVLKYSSAFIINTKNKKSKRLPLKRDCCGCMACQDICPYSAIKMEEDEMKFKYPMIDKSKCKNCRVCINVCPNIQT